MTLGSSKSTPISKWDTERVANFIADQILPEDADTTRRTSIYDTFVSHEIDGTKLLKLIYDTATVQIFCTQPSMAGGIFRYNNHLSTHASN
jgi:hypothetical protein